MVWRAEDPQGNEAAKVAFDVLEYCAKGFDIGCGGHKVFPHLIGLDNLKDTRLFGVRMEPDFILKDCAKLSMFTDGCVESVFSSHTLEHIPDHEAALKEWWRVISPGGHLVLYLPHRDFYPNMGQPGANPDHVHDFHPDDIVRAMQTSAPDWTLLVNEERNGGREYSFLQVYRKEAAGHGQKIAEKPQAKRAGVVRVGGHGDALWASSVCWHLKQQGYHVTVYASTHGAEVLKHDPNIDQVFGLPDGALSQERFLAWRAHRAAKFDRWVDLLGSVENRLLYHENTNEFYLPHRLRHKFGNRNYLEMVHEYADVPQGEWRQRFYPTPAETEWARKMRAALPGPVVVIAPAGSGPVKYWPHSQRLMELLAEQKIYSLVVGNVDAPDVVGVEPYGIFVGMEWPVRAALAYALLADAVVATESLVANAVAFEPMLKVVTLSHSSNENLTKHWINTAAIEATGLACHPCHRIHPPAFRFCARDKVSGAAACLAMARPEAIAELVLEHIERNVRGKRAA